MKKISRLLAWPVVLTILTSCGEESEQTGTSPQANAPQAVTTTPSGQAKVNTTVDKVTDQAKQAVDQLTETTQDVASDVASKVADKTESVVESVSEKASANTSQLKEASQEKIATFVESAKQQLEQQESNLSGLKAMVTDKADDVVTNLISQLDAKLGSARARLSKINNEDSSGLGDAIKSEFSTLMDEAKTLYTQAMEKAKDLKTTEGLSELKDAAGGLFKKI